MSVASIDTSAPAYNPFYQSPNPNKGQISGILPFSLLQICGLISDDQIVSSFNMNPYGHSGIHNLSELNADFEFSSPANTKWGQEKPMFNSSSSLSKPRMVKSRKSINPRSIGSSETQKIYPGFNPFRPVLDNLSGVSSRLESDDLGDDSFFKRSKDFNVKITNKVEKVGNAHIDQISKLKIENQSDSHVAGQSANNLNERGSTSLSSIQLPSKGVENSLLHYLPDNLKKLNLGGSHSERSNFGGNGDAALGFSGGHNVGGFFGTNLASELPNDLKRLNLKDPGEASSQNFVFGTNKSNFVFGSSRKKNDGVAPGITSTLHDKIKNLNLEDYEKSDGPQKDMNLNKSNQTFDSGNRTGGDCDVVVDPMILDEMERLKIGDHSEGSSDHGDLDNSSSPRKEPHGSMSKEDSAKSNHTEFQPVRDEFHGSSVSPVEFETPDPKGKLFTGSNQKYEFSAKKGLVKDTLSRGRKGKLKEPTSVISLGISFSPKENSFQAHSEPSESSSPMDVSPYREIQDDMESATSTAPSAAYSDGVADEELVTATECMDINNGDDMKHDEANVQVSECSVNSTEGSLENSVSVVDTESFKSTSENLDRNEEIEVESDGEVQSCQTEYFSASSSVSSGGSSFTFAASSSAQGQPSASMRHHRKKNWLKPGPDIYNPIRTAVLSDAASSLQFSPVPRVPVLPSQVGQKEGVNLKVISPKSKTVVGNNLEDAKREITSPTAASRAAQEACEKWRLRGNQAYSNGDLEKAEDYYNQGLSCIPRNETSRDCLRALVLCYSNRAATRMSLGRMRDALRDCLVAAEIDPNFFRVQLRAANCYLALGEVGDASRCFKKLLQSTDICVERKLILEASDGIQKVQKVSECMDRSAELLLQKTLTDVENALGVIAEALVISPYSEQLLERKAAALFTLRRYEEVIQLCEQTLEAAEKNSPLLDANGLSSNLEASQLLKNYSFQIWRYSLIFKSNFYLGKLEEALDFLEKQEQWRSMVNKYGNDTLESLIPQVSTAHQLISHKSAGNEAFQAGRHTEAVENYTAALSFNVESRPFAAVCFGNRAAAYQALGQITDAIADCSLAIALDGNYLKAISRRATLFEMIRDYEQAARDLQRLLSLLSKQAEEKGNQLGGSLPINTLADLRQARQRLYQMEEQSRKGVPLNFYLILGVEPSVTALDLKKAYRKAALRHHPDKAGQSLAKSESGDDGLWKEISEEVYKDADRLFKMIGEAYAVLSDPTKRSQYDIEEETRNGQRQNSASSMSRMHPDAPFYTGERSGSSGRQWREVGRSSSTNPYYRGFEPTRPARHC